MGGPGCFHQRFPRSLAVPSQGMLLLLLLLFLSLTHIPQKRGQRFSPKIQQFSSQIQGTNCVCFSVTELKRECSPVGLRVGDQGLVCLSLGFPVGCFLLRQGCASCQPWNAMHSLTPNGNWQFGPHLVLLGNRLWILLGAVERGECSPRGSC